MSKVVKCKTFHRSQKNNSYVSELAWKTSRVHNILYYFICNWFWKTSPVKHKLSWLLDILHSCNHIWIHLTEFILLICLWLWLTTSAYRSSCCLKKFCTNLKIIDLEDCTLVEVCTLWLLSSYLCQGRYDLICLRRMTWKVCIWLWHNLEGWRDESWRSPKVLQ